jgi:hypothetical protein
VLFNIVEGFFFLVCPVSHVFSLNLNTQTTIYVANI